MAGPIKTRYTIVGAGIAGIAAAEAIRELDRSGPLLVVNGEGVAPYCRPLTVEVLTDEKTPEEICLREAQWFSERKITIVTGDPVAELRAPTKQLLLATGQVVAWEKLLVAVGSQPAGVRIAGLEQVPCFTLFTQADAARLKPLCKPGAQALVVGIGLIGLQALTALRRRGVSVVAVEVAPKVLPMILDAEAAGYAQRRLEQHGIDVRVGTSVQELRPVAGGRRPYQALTSTGEVLDFDFLVMAVGMQPNLILADRAGIARGRGIRVSPTMQTSIPDIYAAGDVTEYPDWIEGGEEVHAHWVNAYRQGRIAGRHMAGGDPPPCEPVFLNSLRVFDLPIITMGASRRDALEGAEAFVAAAPARPAYRRLLVRDGRLIGATFVNDVGEAGVFQYLMQNRINIGEVAEELVNRGRKAFEFLDELHRQVVRGDLEWAPSMDLISEYRKNHRHTRWGHNEPEK
ncbi:MAG: NAD(P)/FAD-dependent oxidoreductase [Candidatus Eisenbacteria sp.]|nr:NAD(P)/FAD-dependent oxidoreductase [Candidatus Eisenbacteria bacterium]